MVFAITLTSLCEHLLLFSHVATLKACKALGIRGLCVSARKKTACFCHYWSELVCVCVCGVLYVCLCWVCLCFSVCVVVCVCVCVCVCVELLSLRPLRLLQ